MFDIPNFLNLTAGVTCWRPVWPADVRCDLLTSGVTCWRPVCPVDVRCDLLTSGVTCWHPVWPADVRCDLLTSSVTCWLPVWLANRNITRNSFILNWLHGYLWAGGRRGGTYFPGLCPAGIVSGRFSSGTVVQILSWLRIKSACNYNCSSGDLGI